MSTPLMLRWERAKVEDQLVDLAESGRQLREQGPSYTTPEVLEVWRQQVKQWRKLVSIVLRAAYSTEQPEREFSRAAVILVAGGSPLSRLERDLNGVERGVAYLDSLRATLEFVEAQPGSGQPVGAEPDVDRPRSVFVVHGRDHGMREKVARFIEKLEFECIILDEQANQGRTLIEKLEKHGDVSFAVVLLSPDDWARGPDETEWPKEPNRARQNVVLELGYFAGRLGRANVAALHQGRVELPSDLHGVGYIKIDGAGGWKLPLVQELEAAGFTVDRQLMS